MALNSFTPTSLGGAWHKVSNFVGKMSKVICDLAHFVFGVVSVPT